jgi:hypothetical protein
VARGLGHLFTRLGTDWKRVARFDLFYQTSPSARQRLKVYGTKWNAC